MGSLTFVHGLPRSDQRDNCDTKKYVPVTLCISWCLSRCACIEAQDIFTLIVTWLLALHEALDAPSSSEFCQTEGRQRRLQNTSNHKTKTVLSDYPRAYHLSAHGLPVIECLTKRPETLANPLISEVEALYHTRGLKQGVGHRRQAELRNRHCAQH